MSGPLPDHVVLLLLDVMERTDDKQTRADVVRLVLEAFHAGERTPVLDRLREYCRVDEEARRLASGPCIEWEPSHATGLVRDVIFLMRESRGSVPDTPEELGEALNELGLTTGPAIAAAVWDDLDVLVRRSVHKYEVPLAAAIGGVR